MTCEIKETDSMDNCMYSVTSAETRQMKARRILTKY